MPPRRFHPARIGHVAPGGRDDEGVPGLVEADRSLEIAAVQVAMRRSGQERHKGLERNRNLWRDYIMKGHSFQWLQWFQTFERLERFELNYARPRFVGYPRRGMTNAD